MVNPPSKVFPQDNYCFGDSSCRPCPSLFAQNILLPAIFLGQARATHVTSSWARRQDKMDLKVSHRWAGQPRRATRAASHVAYGTLRVKVCGAAGEWGGKVEFTRVSCGAGGTVPLLLCWKISLLLSSVENIITSTSWHVILPHLLLSSIGLVLMVHF